MSSERDNCWYDPTFHLDAIGGIVGCATDQKAGEPLASPLSFHPLSTLFKHPPEGRNNHTAKSHPQAGMNNRFPRVSLCS